jgi:gamma-glutamyl:cysteine ligase YbdK (ATP-grasp superfamily)
MKAPSLTLGIEEEYQIIDPETRELRSYITEILKEDSVVLQEVKPELHQSMVEIGSKVCRTPADVRAELVRLRGTVMQLAARSGLKIAAARTRSPAGRSRRSRRSSATSACARTSPSWRSSCSSSARTCTSASRTRTS